jgi:hypothetical protein
MKALTISQPWANLIASGLKFVENRTWATSYRGPLAIHAGKGSQYLTPQQLAMYPTGCVVATCELVACVHIDQLREKANIEGYPQQICDKSKKTITEVLLHDFTEGPYLWILEDIRPIQDYEIRGAQGLWNIELETQLQFRQCYSKKIRLVDRGEVTVEYRIQPSNKPLR